jgi:hypothetical protein
MATEPLSGRQEGLPATERLFRPPALDARPEPVRGQAEALDLVQALSELSGASAGLEGGGLEDALLAWVMPRPRNPETLMQARLVPLLGTAADLVSRSARIAPDIARLGSAALEQELRAQRHLAERRANLSLRDAP